MTTRTRLPAGGLVTRALPQDALMYKNCTILSPLALPHPVPQKSSTPFPVLFSFRIFLRLKPYSTPAPVPSSKPLHEASEEATRKPSPEEARYRYVLSPNPLHIINPLSHHLRSHHLSRTISSSNIYSCTAHTLSIPHTSPRPTPGHISTPTAKRTSTAEAKNHPQPTPPPRPHLPNIRKAAFRPRRLGRSCSHRGAQGSLPSPTRR